MTNQRTFLDGLLDELHTSASYHDINMEIRQRIIDAVEERLKAAFMAGVPPWAKMGTGRQRAIASAKQEAKALMAETENEE